MKGLYLFVVVFICLVGFSAEADEIRLGSLYYKNFSVPSNATFTTIIAPVNNVAGAKITTVILYNYGGSITLSADYPDGSHRFILQGSEPPPGGMQNTHLPYPIFLPSGVGLSVVASDTSQAGCHVTYDLMSN